MSARKKVLLVDDEAAMTRVLKRSLEDSGEFEVHVENSGRGGLEAARSYGPDVVLLDMIMPDMPGSEFLAHIRSDVALQKTPVVFLTAVLPDEVDEEASALLNACPGIPKPARADDVISTLREVLRRDEA
jgi:CheY-like chemotaxis protein